MKDQVTTDQIMCPALGIKMLRDAGYKNTAYAIAELIDNSIEANAKHIDIALFEENITSIKTQKLIHEIAIFDDGDGMPVDILRQCISFGWGTRLTGATGLGKFGFGLKGASLSQARRIEIYSWKTPHEVHKTYLDYDEIKQTQSNTLHEPVPTSIPYKYQNVFKHINSNSGTLIIWKNLDKLNPKRSATLINHLNHDISRIFRHFLDDDDTYGLNRLVSVYTVSPEDQIHDPVKLRANDPIYLLKPNNLPGYENQATNDQVGETFKIPVIDPEGIETTISVLSTIALPSIQAEGGNSIVGRHYAENSGISFVRAKRELELNDKGFFSNSDPRYRWIGIEVRFPPELDEYFGVTNNKQSVRSFKKFKPQELEDLEEQAEYTNSIDARSAKMKLDLHKCISRIIDSNMKVVRSRGAGSPAKKSKTSSIEKKFSHEANSIIGNKPTASKKEAENKPETQKIDELVKFKMTSDTSLTEEEAIAHATEEAKQDHAIYLGEADWPGNTFLEVDYKANGALGIVNRKHPFFTQFYDHLRNHEDLQDFSALQTLLMAFVSCEDELQPRLDPDNKIFGEIRDVWGKYLNTLPKVID